MSIYKYLADEDIENEDIESEEIESEEIENEDEGANLQQKSTEESVENNFHSNEQSISNNSEQNQNKNTTEQENEEKSAEEEKFDPDRLTPEQIKNCPTVFEALGMEENRNVLFTFLGISLALVGVGFGSFYLGKKYIPVFFKSIDPYDAPIYSCGLAVVLTQIIVFSFFFWAWGHDVAQEKKERELEEQMRKEKLQKKLKKD